MRVALLTVSDSAASGAQGDLSGTLLHKLVAEGGRTVVRAEIVAADRQAISDWLCRAVDVQAVDLVITSGGTGLSSRDVTPEATRAVLDVEVPGIAEAIRAASMARTPEAMLSRNVAGVRKRTLIINFSGSSRAVTEQWVAVEPVIERAVTTIRDDDRCLRDDAESVIISDPPPSQRARAADRPDRDEPSGNWHNTLVGQPLGEELAEEVRAHIRKQKRSER